MFFLFEGTIFGVRFKTRPKGRPFWTLNRYFDPCTPRPYRLASQRRDVDRQSWFAQAKLVRTEKERYSIRPLFPRSGRLGPRATLKNLRVVGGARLTLFDCGQVKSSPSDQLPGNLLVLVSGTKQGEDFPENHTPTLFFGGPFSKTKYFQSRKLRGMWVWYQRGANTLELSNLKWVPSKR